MATRFPDYVHTAVVDLAGATQLETGRTLALDYQLTASRSLREKDTGYTLEAITDTGTIWPGDPTTRELPITTQAIWRDADTGRIIDVTGGRHTHSYSLRLRPTGTSEWTDEWPRFYLPTPDVTIPAGLLVTGTATELGTLIQLPAEWTDANTAAATAAASSAAAATAAANAAASANTAAGAATTMQTALTTHINAATPHPAYDTDVPNLVGIFENGLI